MDPWSRAHLLRTLSATNHLFPGAYARPPVLQTSAELKANQLRHMMWYDFHQIPYYDGAAISSGYRFMTGVNYEFTLPRNDATKRDLYHCGDGINAAFNSDMGPSCAKYCGEAQGATSQYSTCLGGGKEILDSYLYLTVHGYFNYANTDASGFYTMSWLDDSKVKIPSTQLKFLQDLYTQACMPTQMMIPTFDYTESLPINKFWTRSNYMNGKYTCKTHPDGTRQKNVNKDYKFHASYCTNGTEFDSDTVPYCEWMVRASRWNPCTRTRSPCVATVPSIATPRRAVR